LEGWVILKYAEAQKRFATAVMAAVMAAGTMGAGFTAVAQADTAYADEAAAIVTLDEATTTADTTDDAVAETIDISTCTWPATYCTYDGTAQEPFKKSTNKVIVNGSKDKLLEGTDYTVEYANNIEIGTATATITGIGKYTGTLTVEFDISAVHFDVVVDGKTVYSFDDDGLKALAASSTDNKQAVSYNWGTSVDYVEAEHYITYASLLKAAGVENADTVKVAAADGFGTTFSLVDLDGGKYYPAQTATGYSTEGAEVVPCVLALDYWTASITTTAGEAVATITSTDKNHVTSLRNFEGALESDYTAGNIAGNRFVTGPTSITIQSYNTSASYDLSDVSDWATSYVKSAINKGLITGSNNTFNAQGSLTRSMVATILYRAAGSPAVTTNAGFTDTSAETWYQDAINWAAEQGIVTGYTDANGASTGTFGTYDNITRQDLATMLARYAAKVQNADTNITSEAAQAAPGWSDVQAYAQTAMQWAYANGILTGSSDTGNLMTNQTATREQMAKMIVNLLA
jgi:hypothetical protein